MKQANWIPPEKMDLRLWSIENLKTSQWKTQKKKNKSSQWVVHLSPWYTHVTLVSRYPFQQSNTQLTHLPAPHPTTPPPPKKKQFCISIVFNFFWGGCNTQEKWMQNFRGQIRCLTGDVQVAHSKLKCLRLWAHSTSTNMKRWTNAEMSQPKVMGCMDDHYYLPLVLHWVHFAHRRAPLK